MNRGRNIRTFKLDIRTEGWHCTSPFKANQLPQLPFWNACDVKVKLFSTSSLKNFINIIISEMKLAVRAKAHVSSKVNKIIYSLAERQILSFLLYLL